MKFILSALVLLSAATGNAQSMKIMVSAGNAGITVLADSNNDNELLTINTAAANYLTVKVSDEQIRGTWKRSFYIYDDSDQAIAELKPMQQNEYCMKVKDLLSKLEKNKEYKLFSIVTPQDQTKAMMVKIPPLFVCKIKLSE